MTGFAIDMATAADVVELGPNLRAADVEEVRAASGFGAIDALGRSFDFSTHVWVVRDIGGHPLALWGVGPLSLVEGRGCPWLLASDAFEALGADIARLSRPLLAGMRELYPRLENHVDTRHAKSVRWLQWLGFTIEPASPWGVENRPFHRVWI